MLKKIALVGIFALVSVVSFGTYSSAATASGQASDIASPVLRGLGPCGAVGCK